MKTEPTVVFGTRRPGKSYVERALNLRLLEQRAFALMAKKVPTFVKLVTSWELEITRQLDNIIINDKQVGNLSADLGGLIGCSGTDSHTTSRYCELAAKVVDKVVPRGKAWRKLYDLDRGNGYGF